MSDETILGELADREAIRDLVRRYAHHVWRKDVSALVELFSDEGEMATPELPTIRGQEALSEGFEQMLGEDVFLPFVHNHVIELEGDVASGTCYLDLRATVDGRSMIASGYYDDEYVRVDGEWRFRSRRVTMCRFVPVRGRWVDGPEDPKPET